MTTISWLFLVLGLYVVGKLFMIFVFPRILRRWFTLEHQLSTAEGYVAGPDRSSYMGRQGVTRTDLRPSGKAAFGEEVLDVSSAAGFVRRGTNVVVVEVRGSDLFVKSNSDQ